MIRKIFTLGVFFWILTIGAEAIGFAAPNSAVFNLVVDSESICTAFAVEGKVRPILVTAGHCAEDLVVGETGVVAFDAASKIKYPVTLVSRKTNWRAGVDYAIFSFAKRVPNEVLSTTAQIPEVGDDVSVIEGPLGYIPFSVRGYYSGLAGYADDPKSEITGMYWIQIPGTHGASGSPVMNRAGKVWGILVGGNDQLAGLALVVTLPRIL